MVDGDRWAQNQREMQRKREGGEAVMKKRGRQRGGEDVDLPRRTSVHNVIKSWDVGTHHWDQPARARRVGMPLGKALSREAIGSARSRRVRPRHELRSARETTSETQIKPIRKPPKATQVRGRLKGGDDEDAEDAEDSTPRPTTCKFAPARISSSNRKQELMKASVGAVGRTALGKTTQQHPPWQRQVPQAHDGGDHTEERLQRADQ